MRSSARTLEQIERHYNRGFGQGEGLDYRCWLRPHDFASSGMLHHAPGRIVRRQYTLFSDLELEILRYLERLRGVVDIREQFPLYPIADTIELASDLGIKHPAQRGVPVVMTTDFLCAFDDGTQLAVAVKPLGKLLQAASKAASGIQQPGLRMRTIEKLELERVFWEGRGVRWVLLTDRSIPQALRDNLRWLDNCYELSDDIRKSAPVQAYEDKLWKELQDTPEVALRKVCHRVDRHLSVDPGSSITVLRYLLARQRWDMPLDQRFNVDRPLPSLPVINTWQQEY